MYKLNCARYKRRDSKDGLPDPQDDFSKYAMGLEEWRRKAIAVILEISFDDCFQREEKYEVTIETLSIKITQLKTINLRLEKENLKIKKNYQKETKKIQKIVKDKNDELYQARN